MRRLMGNSNSGWYRGHAPRCEDDVVVNTAKESPIWWGFWTAKNWRWQGHHCGAELRIDRTSGHTLREAGVTIEYFAYDQWGRSTHVAVIERASIVEQPM